MTYFPTYVIFLLISWLSGKILFISGATTVDIEISILAFHIKAFNDIWVLEHADKNRLIKVKIRALLINASKR